MSDKKLETSIFKKLDDFLYHQKNIILQNSDKEYLLSYFQKKKGWLYIMVNEDHNFLKIGRTTKTPMVRSKTLSNTGVLSDYQVVFSLPSFNQIITEKELFAKLKKFRVQGEFFNCSQHHAIESMKLILQNEHNRLSQYMDLDLINLDINLLPNALKF